MSNPISITVSVTPAQLVAIANILGPTTDLPKVAPVANASASSHTPSLQDRIITELSDERFTWRTPKGIAENLNLSEDVVRAELNRMVSDDMARVSDSGRSFALPE